MKMYAVGHASLFDNVLSIEFHEGTDWCHALLKHSKLAGVAFPTTSLEDAKAEASSIDRMIDVKEVP